MPPIKASDFKARCLALLDQVRDEGVTFVILKRGRPVAQVGPVLATAGRYPQDALKGTVEILGDVVAPALPAEAWEALAPAGGPRRRPKRSRRDR